MRARQTVSLGSSVWFAEAWRPADSEEILTCRQPLGGCACGHIRYRMRAGCFEERVCMLHQSEIDIIKPLI